MTRFIEHIHALARPRRAAKSARDMRSLAHKRKMWVTVRSESRSVTRLLRGAAPVTKRAPSRTAGLSCDMRARRGVRTAEHGTNAHWLSEVPHGPFTRLALYTYLPATFRPYIAGH